jgi:hypothetical protein
MVDGSARLLLQDSSTIGLPSPMASGVVEEGHF